MRRLAGLLLGLIVAFVSTAALSPGQKAAVLFYNPCNAPTASALLCHEAAGLAIQGTTGGVQLAIKDTGTPSNNRANIDINDPSSPIVNATTSPKLVLQASGQYAWTAHNLLPYSNAFGSWTPVGVSVSAGEIIASATTGSHGVTSTNITAPNDAQVTASVEAKAAGYNFLLVLIGGTGWNAYCAFNLNTGVAGSPLNNSAVSVSAAITALGNGYYRASLTATPKSGASAVTVQMQINNSINANDSVFTGDGTSGILLRNAQLNRGTTPTAYRATTSAASFATPVQWDPTLGKYGVLSEPQATNLLLNNATLSTQNVTTAATPYTLSLFGTGTVTLSGTSTAGPLVGTGANNRVSLTFTPTAGTLTLTVSGSVTSAQLETGTVPTSPIPTAAATVTRAADAISVATSKFPWSATVGSQWGNLKNFGSNQSTLFGLTSSGWSLYRNVGAIRIFDGTNVAISPGTLTDGVFAKGATSYGPAHGLQAADHTGANSTSFVGTMGAGSSLYIGPNFYGPTEIQYGVFVPRELSSSELVARCQ